MTYSGSQFVFTVFSSAGLKWAHRTPLPSHLLSPHKVQQIAGSNFPLQPMLGFVHCLHLTIVSHTLQLEFLSVFILPGYHPSCEQQQQPFASLTTESPKKERKAQRPPLSGEGGNQWGWMEEAPGVCRGFQFQVICLSIVCFNVAVLKVGSRDRPSFPGVPEGVTVGLKPGTMVEPPFTQCYSADKNILYIFYFRKILDT